MRRKRAPKLELTIYERTLELEAMGIRAPEVIGSPELNAKFHERQKPKLRPAARRR